MGVFTCTCCGEQYVDARFLLEELQAKNVSPSVETRVPYSDVASAQLDGSKPTPVVDSVRAKVDIVRWLGSAANWAGVAAPAAHVLLGPVSAVGGVIGATTGAAQLHQGLTMPSGQMDPHLVAKGSVASGIGTVCMTLGAAGIAFPPLFIAAAALGLVGAAVTAAIDANVNGLCQGCRLKAAGAGPVELNDCDDEVVGADLACLDLDGREAFAKHSSEIAGWLNPSDTRAALRSIGLSAAQIEAAMSTWLDYDPDLVGYIELEAFNRMLHDVAGSAFESASAA